MIKVKNLFKLFIALGFLTSCSPQDPIIPNEPPKCEEGEHIWGSEKAYTGNNDCSTVSYCAACGEERITKHNDAHNHARTVMPDSPYYMYKCDDCGHSYTTYEGSTVKADFIDVSGLSSYVRYSGYKIDTIEDGSCDYLAGHNGTSCNIQITFMASNAGKVKFFIDASARANSDTSTWSNTFPTMSVNGVNHTSTQGHHVYDSNRGASARYYDYYYDYVLEFNFVKGVNKIILNSGSDSATQNQFNIKAFRFIKDYNLSLSLIPNS